MYNPFFDDLRDRKAEASGARHKVSGAKSKKCTLPSDNLTATEKRKLNGPVVTYAVNQPMSWERFKTLPHDVQQAHLDFLFNRFGVGACTIGHVVFGLSKPTAPAYFAKKHLHVPNCRGSAPQANVAAMEAWVRGEPEEAAEESTPEELTHEELTHEEAAPAATHTGAVLKRMALTLEGTSAQIAETLYEYLNGRRAAVEVTINFID